MMGKQEPAFFRIYGAAAVTSLLYGVDFPKTKQELVKIYGDKKIQFSKKKYFKFKDILKKLPDKTFVSAAEVEEIIYRKN